jgi:hypothetical protein
MIDDILMNMKCIWVEKVQYMFDTNMDILHMELHHCHSSQQCRNMLHYKFNDGNSWNKKDMLRKYSHKFHTNHYIDHIALLMGFRNIHLYMDNLYQLRCVMYYYRIDMYLHCWYSYHMMMNISSKQMALHQNNGRCIDRMCQKDTSN